MSRYLRYLLIFGMVVACLLFSTGAAALQPGSVTEDSTPLFDDSSAAFAPNGFGSPAVAWDDRLNRWIMVKEYQSASTDPACPHGIWGLAYSTSTDPEGDEGWSPPELLYEPNVDGSYHSCVVSHPALIWLGPNRRFLLALFKAEGDLNSTACAAVDADPQKCVYEGIGSLILRFTLAGDIAGTPSPSPSLRIPIPGVNFGFPSPVLLRNTGQAYLLVKKEIPPLNPDDPVTYGVYATASTTPSLGWDPLTLVMSPGQASWNQNELFGQEVICALAIFYAEAFGAGVVGTPVDQRCQ